MATSVILVIYLMTYPAVVDFDYKLCRV